MRSLLMLQMNMWIKHSKLWCSCRCNWWRYSILCVLNLKNLGIDKIWVKLKPTTQFCLTSISIKSWRRHGCTCCTSTQLPYGEMSLDDDHYIVKIDIPEKLLTCMELCSKHHRLKHYLSAANSIWNWWDFYLKNAWILEGHLQQLKKLSHCFS